MFYLRLLLLKIGLFIKLTLINAFLHDILSNIVYMEQHAGFISSDASSTIYWLNKAFYRLKRAPHSWFDRVTFFFVGSVWQP